MGVSRVFVRGWARCRPIVRARDACSGSLLHNRGSRDAGSRRSSACHPPSRCSSPLEAFTRGPLLEAPNCLRPFPGAQRRFEARRVKPWRPAVFPRSQKDDRPTRGRERAVGIQAPVALLSAPCMDSGRGRGLVSGDPPRGNDQGNEEAVVRGGQETSKATRVLKQVCSRAWS
jgi:hypothetical protein